MATPAPLADDREIYQLVLAFLAESPCTAAFDELRREVEAVPTHARRRRRRRRRGRRADEPRVRPFATTTAATATTTTTAAAATAEGWREEGEEGVEQREGALVALFKRECELLLRPTELDPVTPDLSTADRL